MIELSIVPVTSDKEKQKVYECRAILSDQQIGLCRFQIIEDTLIFFKLTRTETDIADGLIRATISWSSGKKVNKGIIKKELISGNLNGTVLQNITPEKIFLFEDVLSGNCSTKSTKTGL